MFRFGVVLTGRGTMFSRFCEMIREDVPELYDALRLCLTDSTENHELQMLCSSFDLELKGVELKKEGRSAQNVEFSDFILTQARCEQLDCLLLFSGRLLSGSIIDEMRHRIVNIHPSILPSFKGMKAVDKAVASRSFLLGSTIHFIDEHVDEGVVLMQAICHHSDFEGDYDRILIPAIISAAQVLLWIKFGRVEVSDGRSVVHGADYASCRMIPSLEHDGLRRLISHV